MENVNEIVPRGPRSPEGWEFHRITPEGTKEFITMHNIDSLWLECRKELEAGRSFMVHPLTEWSPDVEVSPSSPDPGEPGYEDA
jgi:hypothetical protein